MKESTYKVPGGKLIKIKLTLKDQTIENLTITGDFFLHPESVIEIIERNLIGSDIDSRLLERRITQTLEDESAQLIGATPEDVVTAMMKAIHPEEI